MRHGLPGVDTAVGDDAEAFHVLLFAEARDHFIDIGDDLAVFRSDPVGAADMRLRNDEEMDGRLRVDVIKGKDRSSS